MYRLKHLHIHYFAEFPLGQRRPYKCHRRRRRRPQPAVPTHIRRRRRRAADGGLTRPPPARRGQTAQRASPAPRPPHRVRRRGRARGDPHRGRGTRRRRRRGPVPARPFAKPGSSHTGNVVNGVLPTTFGDASSLIQSSFSKRAKFKFIIPQTFIYPDVCGHLNLNVLRTDYSMTPSGFIIIIAITLETNYNNAVSRPVPAVTMVLWAARTAQRPLLPLTSCRVFRQEF